jgi:hypothetical protein
MKDFVLGVDFDGTIVQHRFPDIGPPVPGALDWLKKYQELDIKLVLFTMRSNNQDGRDTLDEAVAYLKSNGIELYGINVNPRQHTWTSSPKAYCQHYIDDAAVCCPLIYPNNNPRPYVDWNVVGLAALDCYRNHVGKHGV